MTQSRAIKSKVVFNPLEHKQKAIEQIKQSLEQSDAAMVQYSAACVYALASRTQGQYADVSIDFLIRALDQNYNRQSFETDADLAAIRHLPRYSELAHRFASH